MDVVFVKMLVGEVGNWISLFSFKCLDFVKILYFKDFDFIFFNIKIK